MSSEASDSIMSQDSENEDRKNLTIIKIYKNIEVLQPKLLGLYNPD